MFFTDNKWLVIILFLSVFTSCQMDDKDTVIYYPDLMEIPEGFPDVPFPEDNHFTQDRWELGKKLFFDPIMSSDASISCADCHKPELAFSDDLAFSPGVANREGVRNSPGLANVAYHPYFTREGGVPTLEMQVLVPIQEHNEFDYNIVLLAERLMEDSIYIQMSQKAYDRDPDPYVITRSIATFERSLISGNSPYDQYQYQGNEDILSDSEKKGMDLFFSERTNCSQCHSGFNFSDYSFQNNGLYVDYADEGRRRLTGEDKDLALFKVPGLRNVALTAPYMHDGSIWTLEEVIEHYDSGGKDHVHKSELIRPLNLSKDEKTNLVHFLQSLSDETFIHNPLFKIEN